MQVRAASVVRFSQIARRIFFLVCCVLATGAYFFPPAALAQSGFNRINLNGLEAAEIEKSFGVADQKREGESGRETWSYGRSLILFRDGKVSAWSDAGELTRQMKLSKVRVRDSQAKQEREMWKTPWLSQPRLSNSELLEEIIATSAAREAQRDSVKEVNSKGSKVKLSQESEAGPK